MKWNLKNWQRTEKLKKYEDKLTRLWSWAFIYGKPEVGCMTLLCEVLGVPASGLCSKCICAVGQAVE